VGAPDFFFAVNATFRHLHDHYGMQALVRYWRDLGRDYYRARWERWRRDGVDAIAQDWRDYFAQEPGAEVTVAVEADAVNLDIRICPAIKHLRETGREIVPYFCEHCDHVCGAMAQAAGYRFERIGGMGSCRQRFVRLSVAGKVA
jgi:hypothetical protein